MPLIESHFPLFVKIEAAPYFWDSLFLVRGSIALITLKLTEGKYALHGNNKPASNLYGCHWGY